MADKFINETGLQTIKTWIEGKFALDTDLDTLSGRVDDIVSEGGEPNVIEEVQKNGTALTVTNKAVNVIVPEQLSDLSDGANVAHTADLPATTSDLTNDGDGASPFATQAYVTANGGKIDTISVNGTAQTITNKNVDITVPTAVSDLTNDSGYQTASDVSSAISTAVASAYKYKGSVASQSALPATADTGDVYDAQDTGMNYAWNGSAWDALGQLVDTSVLWTSTTGQSNTLEAMTVAEISAILNPSA